MVILKKYGFLVLLVLSFLGCAAGDGDGDDNEGSTGASFGASTGVSGSGSSGSFTIGADANSGFSNFPSQSGTGSDLSHFPTTGAGAGATSNFPAGGSTNIGDSDFSSQGSTSNEFSDFTGRWSGSSTVEEDPCDLVGEGETFRAELYIDQDDSRAHVEMALSTGTLVVEGTANPNRIDGEITLDDDDVCDGKPGIKTYSILLTRLEENSASFVHEQITECVESSIRCRVKFRGAIERF